MNKVLRFVLCAAGAVLTGCGTTRLTVDDAIIGPRGRAMLVAHVQHEYLRGVSTSLEGVTVDFAVAGKNAGTATTDEHGQAVVECTLPDEPIESFTAMLPQPSGMRIASGRFFTWSPDRCAIAVDIDDTICATDRDHLYFKAADDSEPIAGSRQVLDDLARDFEIVYVTARPQFLSDKTRAWLAAHDFPQAPLLTARGWRAALRQERYKRRALARLRRQLPNLLIGIGDKALDARAYAANSMLAIHIDTSSKAPPSPQTVAVSDWGEIRRFFDANRALLKTPDHLRQILQHGALASALKPF